jgi:hypothetical protein
VTIIDALKRFPRIRTKTDADLCYYCLDSVGMVMRVYLEEPLQREFASFDRDDLLATDWEEAPGKERSA